MKLDALDKKIAPKALYTLKEFFQDSAKEKPALARDFNDIAGSMQILTEAYARDDQAAIAAESERTRALMRQAYEKDAQTVATRLQRAGHLLNAFK